MNLLFIKCRAIKNSNFRKKAIDENFTLINITILTLKT